MLRELHVRNLAVIEDVSVEFGPGLNVLTGETGAGKSLLIDALCLLAGARASTDLIRADAEALSVDGRFEPRGSGWRAVLEEAGFEPGAEVVVRREISRSGRNRVYLDDRPVTLALLARLAPYLLRIHTQRDELGLVSNELQRRWLDASAGAEAAALLEQTGTAHETLLGTLERWRRATGSDKLRLERIDLLRFQIGEIQSAGLREAEEVELRRDRDRLRNAEAISEALGESVGSLFDQEGSAFDRIGRCGRLLEGLGAWLPEAGAWQERLDGLQGELQDLVGELRGELDRVDLEPGRLDELEDRLALLERLFRKYGGSSAEALTYLATIEDELGDLEADEEDRAGLQMRLAEAVANYSKVARRLSKARHGWSADLAKRVHRELTDLAMGKAEFDVELEIVPKAGSPVELEGTPVEFSAAGADRVVFTLRANPGEAAGPVAKVASGGELARLYLALQLAAGSDGAPGSRESTNAERTAAPGLVFDEVDAGIGGAEAAALGTKLHRLSNGGQVLVVTHLPQVASFGDLHFQARKAIAGGRTRICVEALDSDARVEEIARMLAGSEITELSRSHAAELIAGSG